MRYINALLNCIGTDFIGTPACTTPTPDSGLHLHHLPGIGQILAAKVVSADDVQASELFTKVYREGIIKAVSDLWSLASKKGWQLRTQLDSEVIGVFNEEETISLSDPEKISIVVERCDSLASGIMIDFIRIWAENAGTIDIIVEDGDTTVTHSFAVVPGANRLNIDYLATTDFVRISTDLQDTNEEDEIESVIIRDSATCSVNDDLTCDECEPCSKTSANCQFSVNGQHSDNGTDWIDSDTLNGFQVSVTCVADISYIVCKFRYELALAFRYAMAIMFFHELLQSRRGNPWASNESKDLAREQLLILEGGRTDDGNYIKGEYMKALNDAINTIEPHLDTFGVIECIKARVVTSLP